MECILPGKAIIIIIVFAYITSKLKTFGHA